MTAYTPHGLRSSVDDWILGFRGGTETSLFWRFAPTPATPPWLWKFVKRTSPPPNLSCHHGSRMVCPFLSESNSLVRGKVVYPDLGCPSLQRTLVCRKAVVQSWERPPRIFFSLSGCLFSPLSVRSVICSNGCLGRLHCLVSYPFKRSVGRSRAPVRAFTPPRPQPYKGSKVGYALPTQPDIVAAQKDVLRAVILPTLPRWGAGPGLPGAGSPTCSDLVQKGRIEWGQHPPLRTPPNRRF